MDTTMPPAGNLYLVVGYDGSPPATRALDAAVALLQGRAGRIDVLYVAHLPSVDMLSAEAVAEMEPPSKFTADDLTALLHRISQREQTASQQAALSQAA
jgi:nucleotide-binding universal stress UspA family protein